MKDLDPIIDLPAALFPHSSVTKPMVKKVLSFFGPVVLFQPWYMKPPLFVLENGYLSLVEVMNPPPPRKPGEEFRALISEYRQWMRNNQDKGYTEFLRTSHGMESPEESTREIREALRTRVGSKPLIAKANEGCRVDPDILRWHLVLHLAREVEDQRMEADKILRGLKENSHPLKGLLEEEETTQVKGLLEDLPQFDTDQAVDDHQLHQVNEAWFGLFGEYLKEGNRLITFNRTLFEYVTGLWRDHAHGTRVTQWPTLGLRFPDLCDYNLDELTEIKRRYFCATKIRELRNMLLHVGQDPIHQIALLEEIFRRAEPFLPWDLSDRTVDIRVTYLPSLSDDRRLSGEGIRTHLSSKSVILMEAENWE